MTLQEVISTRSIRSFDNLFFKFNVSLPLVTGELLQKTVDVSSVTYVVHSATYVYVVQFICYTTNIYRFLKKLPGNKGERNVRFKELIVERTN